VAAVAAWAFTDLGPAAAVLLGSILVVSGPTVVGPVLQTVRPTRRVGSILKWESIFVDPVGAMLAVITFNVITSGQEGPGTAGVIFVALRCVAVGVVSGALAALAAVRVEIAGDVTRSGVHLDLVRQVRVRTPLAVPGHSEGALFAETIRP
jgi:NhaP-type Na+/H+ or K+/H+ antiporter